MPTAEDATHLEGSVPLRACERLVVALDGQGLFYHPYLLASEPLRDLRAGWGLLAV